MDIKYSLLFLCFILSCAEADRINVAANKPASQSTIEDQRLPSYAVDFEGYDTYSLTSSSDDPDAPTWVSVDLLSRYFIEGVLMSFEVIKGGEFNPYIMEIIMLNGIAITRISLESRNENTCVRVRFHVLKPKKAYVPCKAIQNTFQNIVFVAPLLYQLKVYEFEVLAEKVNIALERPVSQSTTNGTLVADFAVDGKDNTNSMTANPNNDPATRDNPVWLAVDLGHLYHMERVYAHYRAYAVSQAGPADLVILLSDSLTRPLSNPAVCGRESLHDWPGVLTAHCSKLSDEYQFVTLEVPKMHILSLYELKVYATKRNLAFEGLAFQNVTLDNKEAKFAVDSSEETFAKTGAPEFSSTVWFSVDLGDRYYIESVEVIFEIHTSTVAVSASVLSIILSNTDDYIMCSGRVTSKNSWKKEYMICDRIEDTFQIVNLVLTENQTLKVYDLKVYRATSPNDVKVRTILPVLDDVSSD